MDESQPALFRSPGLGSGPKGDRDSIFLGLGDPHFAPGVNLGLHPLCTSTGQGLQGHLDQPDTTPLRFSSWNVLHPSVPAWASGGASHPLGSSERADPALSYPLRPFLLSPLNCVTTEGVRGTVLGQLPPIHSLSGASACA